MNVDYHCKAYELTLPDPYLPDPYLPDPSLYISPDGYLNEKL
jgi:hypothetical protein